MKHILCLCLTALLCCLLYTGCKQQPASFVQSAQLNQNEQELLQLLEIEQPQLFDFSVEGAKSLSLELFTLENGSWKPAGSFSGNIDQPSCTGRILCRTDPDTHQISGLAVDKRRAHITLKQNAAQDSAYIESCFGRSLYPPERLRKAEQELCTGEHLGCHLWFASGVPSPEQAPTPEAMHLAEQAQLLAERNRAFYSKNLELHRSVVLRLTEQIRNCILVHQQPNARVARSGNLDPERVWRAPLLDDSRVFRCAEEENQPSFTVDLLLDASASRLHCQEVIAAQGAILAESLSRCHIPVRVSSFCSLRGYTVLRVLKHFKDKQWQGVNQYFASGWNRDGLALRAAGDLLDFDPGPAPRHLLILLTDASPNDSRRIPPSPENPLGRDYGGPYGVDDTAAEVRDLRRKGIQVSAVFMGENSSIPAAERIYGKNLARIRGMDQLARAAGQLIQHEIRALGD